MDKKKPMEAKGRSSLGRFVPVVAEVVPASVPLGDKLDDLITKAAKGTGLTPKALKRANADWATKSAHEL